MDDRTIAGTDLERLGEPILVPRNLRIEHLHAELALGRDREFDRHLEDRVGLAAGGPSFRELRERRQVGVAALRRAAVDPRDDRVDLRLREAPIVAHFQGVRRIGKPRRHLARGDFVLDDLRPRPHFFVGGQRHRRHFTLAVAADALGENNWCDVFRERWGCGGRGGDPNRRGGGEHAEEEDDTLHCSLRAHCHCGLRIADCGLRIAD
jgi:hypothetical protein